MPAASARRRAVTATALVAAALLSACSGGEPSGSSTVRTSKATSAPNACTWPAANGSVVGLIAGNAGADDVVVAYGSAGQRVGTCTGHGGSAAVPVPFLDASGNPVLPASGTWYAPPIAAGDDVQWLPDNDLGTPAGSTDVAVHGGVRRVTDGARTALAFGDWAVVTTIGTRLLLEHDPYATNRLGLPRVTISPNDWCVLPSITSALDRCSSIAGATGEGTATVDATGTPRWIPLNSRPAAVDGTSGRLATDATSTVAAFLPDGANAADGVESATVDGRALLLPTSPSADGGTDVRWAVPDFAGGAVDFAVHRAPQGAVTFRPDVDPNAAVSADGHSLVALIADPTTNACRLETYHDDGSATTDRALDDPIPGCGRLVRWSDGAPGS